jgi:hypothetical protein
MKFQFGKLVCELSLGSDGSVETRWFRRDGRRTEAPQYLDAADRRQYRAGRDAFLRAAGKLPARFSTGTSWCALQRLAPVFVVAATLTGCAGGGGIGLEAMVADHNCEQAGYQLGTPQYAACRMELARRADANAAAMQAFYARQVEIARQNQPQTCIYNGSNIGGITGGAMSCR